MTAFGQRLRQVSWASVLALAALIAPGCGGGGDAPQQAANPAAGPGNGPGGGAGRIDAALAAIAPQPLSALEASGLQFMREEEQLAREVYRRSAALWPDWPLFDNIAASEATHTAAVKQLLDRYQLVDPLAGVVDGELASPVFRGLLAQLAQASARGVKDALAVGAEIEELDLRDLREALAASDNADIAWVYDSLQRGSRNHLRSFMRALLAQGGQYIPKYLSQAEFDSIVNSPMETGP